MISILLCRGHKNRILLFCSFLLQSMGRPLFYKRPSIMGLEFIAKSSFMVGHISCIPSLAIPFILVMVTSSNSSLDTQ